MIYFDPQWIPHPLCFSFFSAFGTGMPHLRTMIKHKVHLQHCIKGWCTLCIIINALCHNDIVLLFTLTEQLNLVHFDPFLCCWFLQRCTLLAKLIVQNNMHAHNYDVITTAQCSFVIQFLCFALRLLYNTDVQFYQRASKVFFLCSLVMICKSHPAYMLLSAWSAAGTQNHKWYILVQSLIDQILKFSFVYIEWMVMPGH